MNKEVMFNMLVDGYSRLAYTENYIIGYSYKGIIYMTIASSDIVPQIASLDKSGRDKGYSLRFYPNNSIKQHLMKNYDTVALCSKEYFEQRLKRSKYNKGEIFEKLVYNHFNKRWRKDYNAFYNKGDIMINDVAYQIKYEKATFTTEKQIITRLGL